MAVHILAVVLAAAGATAVVVAASSKPPKHYRPPRPGPSGPIGDGIDPDAVLFPDDDAFVERTGTVRIESMLNTPRFPGGMPGYTEVTLVEGVANVKPNTSRRVYCDAYVVDESLQVGDRRFSAIALAAAATQARNDGPIDVASLSSWTEQAQRLVRDFESKPGGVDGGKQRDTTLPTDRPRPPRVPLFRGRNCKDTADAPQGWRAVFESLGLSSTAAPAYFNVKSCEPDGPAYDDERTYDLQLVSVGRRVDLVARVARLPFVQLLRWRAYTASNPLP